MELLSASAPRPATPFLASVRIPGDDYDELALLDRIMLDRLMLDWLMLDWLLLDRIMLCRI